MAVEEKRYFSQLLDFLYETQWLYRFPVTELLVRDCLEQFPDGWASTLKDLDNEELNDLVVNKTGKKSWPESLLSFIEKCLHLDKLPSIVVDPAADAEILPECFAKGMSRKKQHEILRLANLVGSQCEKGGIKTIVDLGAGLGYVCQLLNFLYDYRVLGLESNPKNVESARQRQREYYRSSLGLVSYACAKITPDSATEIRDLLKSSEGHVDEEFCLIGLHACADLGVDACDLFSKIPTARILILMSCCYHKMEIPLVENTKNERFRNFPVSRTLRDYFETSEQRDYCEFLKRPFLRLACQEPAARWTRMSREAHREHAFHVLARAVLESFARKNSLTLRKRARKATRKSQCATFHTYLEDAFLRYEFTSRDEESIDATQLREGISRLWSENCERLDLAEIYTGLQLMLQSPAESLVLRDRRCWLIEMGYDAEIIPVTSRTLSPRSQAIVSRKRNK